MASETPKPATPQAASTPASATPATPATPATSAPAKSAAAPVTVAVRTVAPKPAPAPTPAAKAATAPAKPAASPAAPAKPAPAAPPATSEKNGNNSQKSRMSSGEAPTVKTAVAQTKTTPAKTPAAPANTTFKLPAAVYSPQLLESVIYDIQYYLDWYRQNQIRKQVGAQPKAEPNHADETAHVIEAWLAGQQPTLESLEGLLEHLKNLNLPEIHLTLAALPNRSQRATLVDWFRNNGSPDVLISFVADRNLGGGLVVRTPNHVFDFTWKQQLVTSRDKLAGILKRV